MANPSFVCLALLFVLTVGSAVAQNCQPFDGTWQNATLKEGTSLKNQFQFSSVNIFRVTVMSEDGSEFQVLFFDAGDDTKVISSLSALPKDTTCYASPSLVTPPAVPYCPGSYQIIIPCLTAGTATPGSCTLFYNVLATSNLTYCPNPADPPTVSDSIYIPVVLTASQGIVYSATEQTPVAAAPTTAAPSIAPATSKATPTASATPTSKATPTASATPAGSSTTAPDTPGNCSCTCCASSDACTQAISTLTFPVSTSANCTAGSCSSNFPAQCPAGNSSEVITATLLASTTPVASTVAATPPAPAKNGAGSAATSTVLLLLSAVVSLVVMAP